MCLRKFNSYQMMSILYPANEYLSIKGIQKRQK